MRFAKQLTLFVTSISLVGMLTACDSSSSQATSSNSAKQTAAASAVPSKSASSAANPAGSSKATSSAATASAASAGSSAKSSASTAAKSGTPAKPIAVKTAPQGTLNASLLSLMKIDSSTMQKQLNSGKSMVEVAKSQGVTEQQLLDVFEKNLKQTLDKNVANGKLTQTKEDQMLSSSQATFKKIIEQKS